MIELKELLAIIKASSDAYDNPEHEMYNDWAEKSGAQRALNDLAQSLIGLLRE